MGYAKNIIYDYRNRQSYALLYIMWSTGNIFRPSKAFSVHQGTSLPLRTGNVDNVVMSDTQLSKLGEPKVAHRRFTTAD